MTHPVAIEYAGRVFECVAVDRCGNQLLKSTVDLRSGAFSYLLRTHIGQVRSWTRIKMTKGTVGVPTRGIDGEMRTQFRETVNELAMPQDAPGGAWYRVDHHGRRTGEEY